MQNRDQDKMTEITAAWVQSQFEVSSFISSLIPNYHDAQDVLQRTAVMVVQNYDRYDTERPFRNWAIGVARFQVLKYQEQKKREKMIFNQALIDQFAQTFCEDTHDPGEALQALRTCLNNVQGKSRKVLSLWYVDCAKADDIAAWLGIKKNALYVMLSRIRASLRECVKQRLAFGGEGS